MPKTNGKNHSSVIRKPYSEGHCESECPTAQQPSLPSTFDCVMIVGQKKPLKWRRASSSSSLVHPQRHPKVQPLPTPPATPIKGNGVATQSDDAQTQGVILDSQSSDPSSISLPSISIDPHDLLSSQLSRTSSAQSLTPTPGVMKKRPYKRAIWEIEPVVEWLENNVDGSFFSNRL